MEQKNAVCYVRTSTTWMKDNQTQTLEKYAQNKNYNIIKTYKDIGVPGNDLNRPGLNWLIKNIEEEKFDMLCVDSISRISRDIDDMMHFIENVLLPNYVLLDVASENMELFIKQLRDSKGPNEEKCKKLGELLNKVSIL